MPRLRCTFPLILATSLVLFAGCDTGTVVVSPSAPEVKALEVNYPAHASKSANAAPFNIVWDNFTGDFETADVNPSAKWFYFSAGPFVGNDGVETTSGSGLSVAPPGINPSTSEPAFTLSLGQEGAADNPVPLPGGLDHVKWLVYMNALASTGIPGFDAIAGETLTCEAKISAESFGTAGHPFGSAVQNANDDLRLGAGAMNSIDLETFMVFDFFLTNERIYAFYERLPFADRGVYGNYAAFSFQIPVGERNPGDVHKLAISYDRAAGTVTWFVENKEVFRVDAIGARIDRSYMVLDHGGDDQIVSPRQLNCGMGLFTLLDAHGPGNTGLVKLSTQPDFYFSPPVGEPIVESFVDPASVRSNRLFGQGAALNVEKYSVSRIPSP